MSNAKYSRLPMGDPSSPARESVAIDFSSAFNFKSVFTYSKSVPPYLHEVKEYKPAVAVQVCSWVVVCLTYLILFLTFPISGWFSVKIVQQFERLIVFRLGRMKTPQGPGIVLINPIIDKARRVDVRTRAFNVPPQQILTCDGSAISAGAVVYHRITDVALSVTSIQDLNHSLRNLGQAILLKLLSSRELADIERDKALMNTTMQQVMNEVTQSWGVEVSRTDISEITVIQEASTNVDLQKMTSMLGQVAGHIASTTSAPRPKKEPPPSFTSFMAMAAAAQQSQMVTPTTPAPLHQVRHPTSHQEVPVTSTLVELAGEGAVLTPEELLRRVQPVLDETLVREVRAVFQFVVKGGSSGIYFLDLSSGAGCAGVGSAPRPPDVTLTMTLGDMQAMFEGQLSPTMAYMGGRLEIEGDRNIALGLEKVINRIQDIQR